jgi:urease accessory protein
MAMAGPWVMITVMRMDNAHLLTMAQWLSPAYPVGAFAWSHGLERAIGRGDITDGDDLAMWLGDVLQHGAGRNDAILLYAAYAARDAAELADLAQLAAVLAPSRERRQETLQQGAAFAATTRNIWQIDLPDMAYPVAVGRAGRLVGVPVLPLVQLWLQAFASNLVQAAQRLMPLGQTQAQTILAGLAPSCQQIATAAQQSGLDALGSAVFAADTASMQHCTQYARIFRS